MESCVSINISNRFSWGRQQLENRINGIGVSAVVISSFGVIAFGGKIGRDTTTGSAARIISCWWCEQQTFTLERSTHFSLGFLLQNDTIVVTTTNTHVLSIKIFCIV